MKKWKDRKNFNFFFVWLGVKNEGMKKVSLYKVTHTLLLKNGGNIFYHLKLYPRLYFAP